MSVSSWILVTGGSGYVGSHALVELLAAGFEIVCIDNFCNSSSEAVRRVERICGRSVHLIEGDVRDPVALRRAFTAGPISAVVHFAALKAVGDSVAKPLDVDLAHRMLGWRATRTLHDMCADAWRWKQANPHGHSASGGTK
jgi:UDP-glucose 4-epimerase